MTIENLIDVLNAIILYSQKKENSEIFLVVLFFQNANIRQKQESVKKQNTLFLGIGRLSVVTLRVKDKL